MKLGTKINSVLVVVIVCVLTIGFWFITNIEARNIKNQITADTTAITDFAHQDVERMFTQISSQKDSLQKAVETLADRIPGVLYVEVVDTKGNSIATTRTSEDASDKARKLSAIQEVLDKKTSVFKEKDEGAYYEIEYFSPVFDDRKNIINVIETEVKTRSRSPQDVAEAKRMLNVASVSVEQSTRTINLAIEDGLQYLQKIVEDTTNFGKIDSSTSFGLLHDFIVMDSNLGVLAGAGQNSGGGVSEPAEYVKARQDVVSGSRKSLQYSRVVAGESLIVHVRPIKIVSSAGARIVGVVETQVLSSAYEGRINDLRIRMLGMGIVFTATLIIVLAVILEREVVGPLRRYSIVARKIAEGDLNQKVEYVSKNEIGQFGEVFNSMVKNLREVDNLKSDFISVAAHQLRTPLSGVKWVLKLVLDGDLGVLTDAQVGMLKRGYDTNEKMIHLVNDLLNVTRIENGKFGYTLEKNDFTKLLKMLMENVELPSKERNIEVTLENHAGDIPEFTFDPEKLLIALQNIVDNAMKYTFPGGKVAIVVSKHGDYIEIKITDTGVGIPKADIGKLFTKFFRAENVIHLQTDGSGLGLFIVKSIIMRHGGQIWVDSVEGKGTTFTVMVPTVEELIPKDDVVSKREPVNIASAGVVNEDEISLADKTSL